MSENAKIGPLGAVEGINGGAESGGFEDPALSAAIRWKSKEAGAGHAPSCQCKKCLASRDKIRAAAAHGDCDCGECSPCWARLQIVRGRI